jgi:1,4-dihydroxy-2-naphthoate octaprenyltransferase
MIYTAFMILTYVWILAAAAVGIMPRITLLALLTLPLAYKGIRGSFGYNDLNRLIPALGSNVLTVLGVPLFLGIGYILATIFLPNGLP